MREVKALLRAGLRTTISSFGSEARGAMIFEEFPAVESQYDTSNE